MFNIYWFDDKRFMQLNGLDKIINFSCKVLGDHPKDTTVFQSGRMYRGLEHLIKKATITHPRMDGSNEFDHLVGTANLEESLYITTFWDAYYAMKKNDKASYFAFQSQATNILLLGTSVLLGSYIIPIMYRITSFIDTNPVPLDILNYQISIPLEKVVFFGLTGAMVWAVGSSFTGLWKTFPEFTKKIKSLKKTSSEVFTYIPGTKIPIGEKNRSISIGHDAKENGYWNPIKEYLLRYGSVGQDILDSINYLSYKSIGDRVKELASELYTISQINLVSEADAARMERKARIIYVYLQGQKISDTEDYYYVPTEVLEEDNNFSYRRKVGHIINAVANGYDISIYFKELNLNWRENYSLWIEALDTDLMPERREPNLRRKLCDTVHNLKNPPPGASEQQKQLRKYAGGITNIFKVLKNTPGWGYYNPFKVAELLNEGDLALARLSGYTPIKDLS